MEKPPDTIDVEFEEKFWPAYPKKIAKGTARRAFRTARKKVAFDVLMTALARFTHESRGKEATYVCHASTWLNGERWADETPTTTRSDSALAEPVWAGLTHGVWEGVFAFYRRTGVWMTSVSSKPGTIGYRGPTDLLRSEEVVEMERLKKEGGRS